MRRYGVAWIALGAFLFQGGFAKAQNSLQALEQELNDAKQQHQEASAQELSNFFGQIDPAMASPDAAVALYQQAGGVLPDPSPVVTQHESESASERATRLGLDQSNLSRLGAVLQLHCGLMHYAALFVVKPDQKGLQEDWMAWLRKAAQIYPQLGMVEASSDQPPDMSKKKKDKAEGGPVGPTPKPFNPTSLKAKAMRDSIISKFLGFKEWADKDQGGWAVQDLPKFYRATILEPLRVTPTPATLAAWDAYIGMANADEKDNDKWNQVVYPPLQFDRACDDYTVSPSTEKLEGLVKLIKANPTYPGVEDWISRVHQLIDDYTARRTGKPVAAQTPSATPASAPVSAAPAATSNVVVTTEQQGDMTIITTHTNSASVTNAPPTP